MTTGLMLGLETEAAMAFAVAITPNHDFHEGTFEA
jgi:hypothetical protein